MFILLRNGFEILVCERNPAQLLLKTSLIVFFFFFLWFSSPSGVPFIDIMFNRFNLRSKNQPMATVWKNLLTLLLLFSCSGACAGRRLGAQAGCDLGVCYLKWFFSACVLPHPGGGSGDTSLSLSNPQGLFQHCFVQLGPEANQKAIQ